jgi:hypothetical protein
MRCSFCTLESGLMPSACKTDAYIRVYTKAVANSPNLVKTLSKLICPNFKKQNHLIQGYGNKEELSYYSGRCPCWIDSSLTVSVYTVIRFFAWLTAYPPTVPICRHFRRFSWLIFYYCAVRGRCNSLSCSNAEMRRRYIYWKRVNITSASEWYRWWETWGIS